jgi:hypothetical protein
MVRRISRCCSCDPSAPYPSAIVAHVSLIDAASLLFTSISVDISGSVNSIQLLVASYYISHSIIHQEEAISDGAFVFSLLNFLCVTSKSLALGDMHRSSSSSSMLFACSSTCRLALRLKHCHLLASCMAPMSYVGDSPF